LFPLPLQPSANAFVSRWTVCSANDMATRSSAKTCRADRTCGRYPAHPSAIAAAYDSGDHLHPNDAGYKAMAESVDLKLFQ